MRDRDYDIVIVGSGAGGGAVAKELAPLAADGRRIAVLEWGPKLAGDAYTGREVEMARQLYVDSGGVLTKDRTLTLAYGRAYGGSTVVYTGTSLTIPEEVVERWDVPGIDAADLERRSAKYLDENNVHLLDEAELNDNNRLFRDGCRALGYRVRQFPINVKGCRASSLCNLGCPNGAKQGTHEVQLPAAEAAGVEVVTNCRVTRIDDRGCDAVVADPGFGLPSRWEPGRYRVTAKVVVVCGGAINSAALLLRSGFGERLPVLGRYLTLHPALILVGEHDRPISNFNGHPKSFYCDEFWAAERFLLETCMYFPFTTSKNLIGFGAEHSELMRAFDRLQMILVLAVDPAVAENRITVDAEGEPVVDYTMGPEVLDALHRSMIESARIFFAAGARRVHAPAGVSFFIDRRDADRVEDLIPRSGVLPGKISVTSAHMMGGCRMGRDRTDSVTDAWGRVHGARGLYVADSGLFPQASEINPYITVMALADRVAEDIRTHARELLAA
ncbi:MAG: GMC family oxidoreductase [Holophagae bacterium]